jgi:DNA replication protein DnaC
MTNESTMTKLHEMRLNSMAEQYNDQLLNSKYKELSIEDRFSLLVDVEWARRKNNKLGRLIRNANLRYTQACIEDIEYHADRRLDKVQILRLVSGNYIQEKHNLTIKRCFRQWKILSSLRLRRSFMSPII